MDKNSRIPKWIKSAARELSTKDFYKKMLEDAGFKVTEAWSGKSKDYEPGEGYEKEAVEYVAEYNGRVFDFYSSIYGNGEFNVMDEYDEEWIVMPGEDVYMREVIDKVKKYKGELDKDGDPIGTTTEQKKKFEEERKNFNEQSDKEWEGYDNYIKGLTGKDKADYTKTLKQLDKMYRGDSKVEESVRDKIESEWFEKWDKKYKEFLKSKKK